MPAGEAAVFAARLEECRGRADGLERLCEEMLVEVRQAEGLRAKVAGMQKELDSARALIEHQTELVSTGLMGGRSPPGTPTDYKEQALIQKDMMLEVEKILRHVTPETTDIDSTPKEFQELHSQLISSPGRTSTFASSALTVMNKVATVVSSFVRVGEASKHTAEKSVHKVASLHSTILSAMHHFDMIGSIVPTTRGIDEALTIASNDMDNLLAAITSKSTEPATPIQTPPEAPTPTPTSLSSIERGYISRLISAVTAVDPNVAKEAANVPVTEALTLCTARVNAFTKYAIQELTALLPSNEVASNVGVTALIQQVKMTVLKANHDRSTKHDQVTRANEAGILTLTLLSKLSPNDAVRLQSRMGPGVGLDLETALRAVMTHVENLQAKLAAKGSEETSTHKLRLLQLDGMLSEVMDPSTAPLTASTEDKLHSLQKSYQTVREANFKAEEQVAKCGSVLDTLLDAGKVQLDAYDLDSKIAAMPRVVAMLEVNATRGEDKEIVSCLRGLRSTVTGDESASRQVDHALSLLGDDSEMVFAPSAYANSNAVHKIHGIFKTMDLDVPGEASLANVELAATQLNQRVREAERRCEGSKIQLHRYIARVQLLVQTYDTRPLSKRHVHIGNLDDSDYAETPGMDDLESLLQGLVRNGGDLVVNRDTMLDSIEADMRLILPPVESLVGVPPLIHEENPPLEDSYSRLAATHARWKRVLEYHRAGGATGKGLGERVLSRTLQHFITRLKSALARHDLDCTPMAPNELDLGTVEAYLAELDHLSNCTASWVERLGAERAHVLATLETLDSATEGLKDISTLSMRYDPSESKVVTAAERAAGSVADLVGRYSGTHTRLQRLSSCVMSCVSQIDKTCNANKVEPKGQSLSKRSEDIPEHALQEAITRLQSRIGKAKIPLHDQVEPTAEALTPVVTGQLRYLASQAPSTASLPEVVSCIGARIAAADSDRVVQKREGERARTMWRKLHDEVTRKLKPLLEMLEGTASGNVSPLRETEGDEGRKAAAIIAKLEQRVTMVFKSQQQLTADLGSQRARRIDYEGRLKNISKHQSKGSREISRLCSVMGITPVPVSDEMSGEVDVAATIKLVNDEIGQVVAAADEVTEMRSETARRMNEAETHRATAARIETKHDHMSMLVCDVLKAAGLYQVEDDEWTALCCGLQGLAPVVTTGQESAQRIGHYDALLGRMSEELDKVKQAKVRFSLSPLTASSVAATPRRSPPPPPSPPTTVSEDEAEPTDDPLVQQCNEILMSFKRLSDAADNERRYYEQLQAAQHAFARISSVVNADDPNESHTAVEDVDPSATADAVVEKVGQLIEVSAASAAEKAKLIKQNLELNAEVRAANDEAQELQQELRVTEDEKHSIERKLEAADMFVKYAQEMKRDAEEDAGQEQGEYSDDEDGFKEVVAVRAYQSYLQLRKERETLKKRLDELETDAEAVQLQEDFVGGVSAKLAALQQTASDALIVLSEPVSTRAPSRTPPQVPGQSTANPNDVIGSLNSLDKSLHAIKVTGKELLHDGEKLMLYQKALSHGLGVPFDGSTKFTDVANIVKQASSSMEGLMEHALKQKLEGAKIGGREREREKERDRDAWRNPYEVGEGEQERERNRLGSPLRYESSDAEMSAPGFVNGRSVSPSRSPAHMETGNFDLERALVSVHSKLEDIVGKVPGGGSSLLSLAWHLDAICGGIVSEMRYLARHPLPGQPLLEAVKGLIAAPLSPQRGDTTVEAVKSVVNQLLQLANGITSAPVTECTKLLLRSTKRIEDDPLGLLSALKRLHIVVVNKLDAAPRELKEWRSKAELLQAQIKELEAEAGRKELSMLSDNTRQTAQMHNAQKQQWDNQRKVLEERLARGETQSRGLQQQLDEAMSNLAISRNRLAHNRTPSVSPTQSPKPTQQHQNEESATLRLQLEEQVGRFNELKHYTDSVTEKLDEKERSKKEYKDKLRKALEEIDVLEDERERMKMSFQGQLGVVKEQLLKLQGKGSRNREKYVESQRSDVQRMSKPPRPTSPSASYVARPQDTSVNSSITVPQEFKFNKSRGRTGCWVCDSPAGPTKYGGSIPHHNCTRKKRDPPEILSEDLAY